MICGFAFYREMSFIAVVLTERLSIRISMAQLEAVRRAARQEGISVGCFVRRALRDFLAARRAK